MISTKDYPSTTIYNNQNKNNNIHTHNNNINTSNNSYDNNINNDIEHFNRTNIYFENKLLNDLEDMDDPLDLFLNYINWINSYLDSLNNNNSNNSNNTEKITYQLQLIIERCLNYIRSLSTYDNDPRFVNIWLYYIDNFYKNDLLESESILIFMLINNIGNKLSMFYIYFAKCLLELNKINESIFILNFGVNNNARPINKLINNLNEFNEQSIKNYNDNFSFNDNNQILNNIINESNEPNFIQKNSNNSNHNNITSNTRNTTFENAKKLQIFSDDTKNIENILSNSTTGKNLKEDNDKINTTITHTNIPRKIYKIIKLEGRKPEKIDCNFDLIYNSSNIDNDEINFEQMLAIRRNLFKKVEKKNKRKILGDLPSSQPPKMPTLTSNKFTIYSDTGPSNIPNENITDANGAIQRELTTSTQHQNNENMTNTNSNNIIENDYKKVTYTSILPLKDEENHTNTFHSTIGNNQNGNNGNNENTVTIYSKDAMNEVYSMFNQNYNENENDKNDDNLTNTNKFSIYENFTQEFTRQNIDDLTEVKPDNVKINNTPEKTSAENSNIFNENKDLDFNENMNVNEDNENNMSPIQEKTENSFITPLKPPQRFSQSQNYLNSQSSPFISQPPHLNIVMSSSQESDLKSQSLIIEHPLGQTLRNDLLSTISPPLSNYSTFCSYNHSLNMSNQLKKIHKVTSGASKKKPIVNFQKTNDFYCIQDELGKGGYATVYLAESGDGDLKALKVEKPANLWEYYILKQVELRLKDTTTLFSIVNVHSLHFFKDESYLVLNYINQGTILDLVNFNHEDNGFDSNVDECLCIFLTIQIMKVIENIHEVGIIHGDLKPDNCMIRFEPLPSNVTLGEYNNFGENGWDSKGVYLIDFGRSFDLTLYKPGTKFLADWPTDQQDCYEMRSGKPWTYESDYYGLAGIIHSLLFGNFIDTVQLSNGKFKLRNNFQRSWQKDIWTDLFDILLNSGNYELPITSKLKLIRLRMEDYLLDEKIGKRLRSLVLMLEKDLLKFKDKSLSR